MYSSSMIFIRKSGEKRLNWRVRVIEAPLPKNSTIPQKRDSSSSPTLHIVKDHPTLPHDAEIHPFGWPLVDTVSKVTPPPPPFASSQCRELRKRTGESTKERLGAPTCGEVGEPDRGLVEADSESRVWQGRDVQGEVLGVFCSVNQEDEVELDDGKGEGVGEGLQ